MICYAERRKQIREKIPQVPAYFHKKEVSMKEKRAHGFFICCLLSALCRRTDKDQKLELVYDRARAVHQQVADFKGIGTADRKCKPNLL